MVAEAKRINRLVEEWQAGVDREENFRRLFERYYRPVYRFFEKRGLPSDESHDLTEETFIRVYRGMQSFRHEARFDTWLFQIAANTYRKALRHQSALKRAGKNVPLEIPNEQEGAEPGDTKPADSFATAGPLDEVLEKEKRRLLREAMDELPRQMRRCVMLRVYQELSYQEISIVLRLSTETVKAHLFQARQRLKGRLADYFGDLDV